MLYIRQIGRENPAVALTGAALQGANLRGAEVSEEQLANTQSLQGAIMPDGQNYESWLEDKEGSRKDVENE